MAWIIILLPIIIYNEMPKLFGQEVLLKVAPYDPRDLMRGDYVELTFEEISDDSKIYNELLYSVIKTDETNVAHLVKMTDKKPKGCLFIKGEKEYKSASRVTYGIEHYFASKKEIKKIERGHGSLYAKVKIDKTGRARLVGVETKN